MRCPTRTILQSLTSVSEAMFLQEQVVNLIHRRIWQPDIMDMFRKGTTQEIIVSERTVVQLQGLLYKGNPVGMIEVRGYLEGRLVQKFPLSCRDLDCYLN